MKMPIILATAIALGLAPATFAEHHEGHNGETHTANKPITEQEAHDNHSYGQRDGKVTPRGLVRASELMNVAVYGQDDEQVGVVNDVVLNAQSGEIQYVALSTGGFLGLGDELHAIPFKAFKCDKQDGERMVTLDVATKALEDAKGFDQDNWPDMANNKWRQANDRQYKSSQRPTMNR